MSASGNVLVLAPALFDRSMSSGAICNVVYCICGSIYSEIPHDNANPMLHNSSFVFLSFLFFIRKKPTRPK